MTANFSKFFLFLKKHPEILNKFYRGVERETLRITSRGDLAKTVHPRFLGKPLTHPWITTDFSEISLEFITPVHTNVEYMLSFLRDLHRHTIRNLNCELIWPLSIPYIEKKDKIEVAKYGSSNLGRFKTLYREGLKNRYGSLMQMISGVHYNFSFSKKFWKKFLQLRNFKNEKEKISDSYCHIIRNYYRFGWIILYLFGSSPVVCALLAETQDVNLPFKKTFKGESYYLPYATSLRMSDFGYKNKSQNNIKINFNSFRDYISSLKTLLNKPSIEFSKIGIYGKNGKYFQVNNNVLQIENELYTPIRPKSIVKNDESPSESLCNRGIEYLEIRVLDVNPFTSIGIDEFQIYFLDLFLIWCLLVDSSELSKTELEFCEINWNTVALEGRNLKKIIFLDSGKKTKTIKKIGLILFKDLFKISKIFGSIGNNKYYYVCSELVKMFKNSALTYSGRSFLPMVNDGIKNYALKLANFYYEKLSVESYQVLKEKDFIYEKYNSIRKQYAIKRNDQVKFDTYLKKFYKK